MNQSTTEPGGKTVRLERLNISLSVALSVLLSLLMLWINNENSRIDKLEAKVDMLQTDNFDVQLGISDSLGLIRADISSLKQSMDNTQKSLEDIKRQVAK